MLPAVLLLLRVCGPTPQVHSHFCNFLTGRASVAMLHIVLLQQHQGFASVAQNPADFPFFHPSPLNGGLVDESTCVIQWEHLGMRWQTVRSKCGLQAGEGQALNR